jgi:hypothetical protein
MKKIELIGYVILFELVIGQVENVRIEGQNLRNNLENQSVATFSVLANSSCKLYDWKLLRPSFWCKS